MASKKKSVKTEEIKEKAHELVEEAKEKELVKTLDEVEAEDTVETPVVEEKEEKKEDKKKEKSSKKGPKYPAGSIVYITKDTEVDLKGFNLSISQYKNSTYTVEAYNEDTGVYTLRHLKLLLHLKEANLMAPDEKAHDSVNRIQF